MTPVEIAWNRFGLGGRPQDNPPADPKRWLAEQFANYDARPAAIASRPSVSTAIEAYTEARMIRREARRSGAEDGGQEQVRMMRQGVRRAYLGNVAARAQVAIESPAPFAERLVHFWSNHFAVSVAKNQVRGMAGPHEFEAIRPNLLGSFRDMLRAAVLHPAMLVYLDQAQSSGPSSLIAQRAARRTRREVGLNENLAREILELHTLGVNGGYSQNDVTQFAHAMTGWTVAGLPRARRAHALPNGSAWAQYQHEPGAVTVLGQTYRQQDHEQSLAIIDALATHPSTAKHIATKLARHFAGDEPPASMVERLENAFLASDGDLPTLYETLIDSPEAWVAGPVKFRTPWEWSLATFRAIGSDRMNERNFFGLLRELGQLGWAPASPKGYDDVASSWAAPDALIRRVEAADRLASLAPTLDALELARKLYPSSLNDGTATAIRRAASGEQALALFLASPEMMRR